MEEQALIPGLPDDLSVECLVRLPFKSYPALQAVCHRWKSLLSRPSFRSQRKLCRLTDHCLCWVQAHVLPPQLEASGGGEQAQQQQSTRLIGRKICHNPKYGLCMMYSSSQSSSSSSCNDWEWLPPIPEFGCAGLPLFCQCLGMRGMVIVLGGWDPTNWEALNTAYIFDLVVWKWRKAANMLAVRSFFACGADERSGRIFVAGGHDHNKNALRTAEVYDLLTDKWEEVGPMAVARDECKGAIVNGEFFVVSGYPTQAQGQFLRSAEVLEQTGNNTSPSTWRWNLVENMWPHPQPNLCPTPPNTLLSFRGSLYALRNNSDLVVYEPALNVWTVAMETLPKHLKISPCAAVFDDSIALFVFLSRGPTSIADSSTLYLVSPKEASSMASVCTRISPPPAFSGFPLSACTVQI